MDTKMKRRDFLKISALASVAVVAAACTTTATPTAAPAVTLKATEVPKATAIPTTAPTAAPKATEVPKATVVPTKVGFQGDILFYAQYYTPTSETTNPDPKAPQIEAMKTLSTQWMDTHPGINLMFLQPPAGDYATWIQTQLIGGTGPDIFWYWLGTLHQWVDDGKTVSLNDYLEMPNRYIPEDKGAWKNTFKNPFLDSYSAKGNFGGVPENMNSTGIFANVDMLKSVGIDVKAEIVPELGSPKDWATMISWCQKLKDAGLLAISAGIGLIQQWWITGVMSDQFMNSWIAKYDGLNYHNQTPQKLQKGIISQEEFLQAYFCDKLDPFADPGVRDMFRVIKDWTQYMPVGFAGEDLGNPLDLFLTNQLAMYWQPARLLGTVLQDNRRKFEFTSFWVPPVTKATSEFVPDPPYLPIGVGGFGSVSYGLNQACISRHNVDECVDWLMFITTPKNNEMIVNEVPSFIPSIKQARALPEVENLFIGETRLVSGGQHPVYSPYGWFGYQESKWTDALIREETLYFLGESTEDTFFANLKAAAEPMAKDVIRRAAAQYTPNSPWDLTQWKCQPAV